MPPLMPAERCFHCEVAKLQAEQFADQPIEVTIQQLLELLTDFVAGSSLDDQMRLFELAERSLMENRNDVLRKRWKVDSPPSRAGAPH